MKRPIDQVSVRFRPESLSEVTFWRNGHASTFALQYNSRRETERQLYRILGICQIFTRRGQGYFSATIFGWTWIRIY